MPLVKIEVRKRHTPEKVQAIMDAVHQAQRDALKIPAPDRQIRYIEHKSEHFHVPPGKSENYTLVDITLFDGRSLEAKRMLYRNIVTNLAALDIEANDVFIVLHEVPMDNWGIRGGFPASEIDLDFKVGV